MNQIAKVSWSATEGRYELRILNILKAYSEGATQDEHEIGKGELCQMATDKGYTVIEA